MKAVQKFTPEYLELCKTMRPDQIVQFLEDFRLLHGQAQIKQSSQLISIKIPESLLRLFKEKCRLSGIRYQTQIKKLMIEWL